MGAPFDRRSLLRGFAGLSGAAFFGGARVAWSAPLGLEREPRHLVLLQLAGGNDGLSTVVPWADDAYGRARASTRLDEKEVLALDDYRGLHPALVRLREEHAEGRLAIVEGVGYPRPNRSHFKSFEIWHTADPRGRAAGDGWVGRLTAALDGSAPDALRTVHVGAQPPYSLQSATHPAASFGVPESYRWFENERDVAAASVEPAREPRSTLDALRGVLASARASSERVRAAAASYEPRVEYPDEPLARALRVAASLLAEDAGTRVVSVELGGFDTHVGQRARHDACMAELDASLGAFLADLRGTDAGKRTIVVAFSEFGRRVAENGSEGTDHGTAGPLLVAGEPVRGGLYGKHPSLSELDEGDLVHTTDFRSVYATVAERWFGVEHERVLGARYPLPRFV